MILKKRIASFCQEFTSEQDNIKELCLKYGVSADKFLEKHYNLSCNYLASQSNCISQAITGPSNFPVARMAKRGNWAFNHLDKLCNFTQNFEKLLKKNNKKKMKVKMIKKQNGLKKVAVLKKKSRNYERLQRYDKKRLT